MSHWLQYGSCLSWQVLNAAAAVAAAADGVQDDGVDEDDDAEDGTVGCVDVWHGPPLKEPPYTETDGTRGDPSWHCPLHQCSPGNV